MKNYTQHNQRGAAKYKIWLMSLFVGVFFLSACAQTDIPGTGTTSGTATPKAHTHSGSPSPAASGTAAGNTLAQSNDTGTFAGGGGGKNIVRVINQKDGILKARGNIQLNRIPGPNVEPVNFAYAYSSCTDCKTFAVALQINLISKSATRIVPQNAAVAINYRCTRCVTVARALQYVYQVDDPTQVPQEVTELIKDMNEQLHAIQSDEHSSVADVEARINSVIAQFQQLAPTLRDQRDESHDETNPNATPEPSVTASPLDTPTVTGTPAGSTSQPVAPTPTTAPAATAVPTIPATATTVATPAASTVLTSKPTPAATP